LTIVQQLSAVPFAKATASTAMARNKVKAVPILMAFMAMVCSNNCEVSISGPKIGQNWPKIGQLATALDSHGQEKGESRSDPHGLHGYGM
jgi:hypothetical protein